MFQSRRSRESKVVDSEALAAASAIGKALDQRGTKVDVDKLPHYNSISRSNSIARAMSISGRNNSLRQNRDSRRSSSLQYKTPRPRGSYDESEFVDAEDTFQQFGGPQAQNKQVTVKKYVPGPSGLRLVEVPVSDVHQPSSGRSSLTRRSTSMHSGLSVRNSSLRSNSLRRKSSLTFEAPENRKGPVTQTNGGSTKRAPSPSTPSRGSVLRKPLAQQSLEEETDEQLEDEHRKPDAINPTAMSTSPVKVARGKPSAEARDSSSSAEIAPPKLLVSPPNEEHLGEQRDFTNSVSPQKDEPEKQAPKKTVEDVINEDVGTGQEDTGRSNGSSMAQYIRSANQYLNKAHELPEKHAHDMENSSNGNSETVESGATAVEAQPLARVNSPMKSALKKRVSSHSINGQYAERPNSTAHDAYLSLTTAENTRLNAQIANDQNKRQPSTIKSRPHSVMNGRPKVQNKENVDAKLKHRSVQGLPSRADTPPVRSSMRPNSSKVKNIPPQMQSKAKSHIQGAAFYPPEPPQKRSSFERERPEHSHMGFKKLSLREALDSREADQFDETQYQSSSVQSGKAQSPQRVNQSVLPSGSVWKSRFHDSDSEDENDLFAVPPQGSNKAAKTNGVFPFTSKNNDDSLQPPQPRYVQSATAPNSRNNTPNKKKSTLSLRSASSMSNNAPAKRGNNLSNRFFSEQLPAVEAEQAEGPKKKSFGKKLKKIFGRKK
ncbi:LADA_0G10616g1_1 [Lachancea dasiensis]|uniref:LADA_0G10616g1_1 n=1 Tax=Lachancea dasiensis TaxID=1072105 RepID=A0A1G4JV63_9SACH|nr:LADA_0G10616g1_1 [Lachancea dasiensis]